MKFRKITTGFVVQNFVDGKCESQEFVSGDECSYEDMNEEPIDEPSYEYQSFEMVQPSKDST